MNTAMPAVGRQTADAVLMLRPACFGYNAETAQTNPLQRPGAADAARAVVEFDGLARTLRAEGIEVAIVEDTTTPAKPDAVFPNNWISFHADGTVVLYPMQPVSRRAERRPEVIESVCAALGFRSTRVLDLSGAEREGRFLEGTGSLVLDHQTRTAYACLSPRTDADLVVRWCAEMGYAPIAFRAGDAAGMPWYHTNVMLSIGSQFAVVAAESILDVDRPRVLQSLRDSGRDVIEIDRSEVAEFGGNVLELASWDEALGDTRVLVMSARARAALSASAYSRLSGAVDTVLAVPVPSIETAGGGSVRCMLAEVFR